MGAAIVWTGAEMIVRAGSTKLIAAVNEWLLSGQQDIAQLLIALPPWCSQFIGAFAGAVCCGRA
jgi:hypothetical protein